MHQLIYCTYTTVLAADGQDSKCLPYENLAKGFFPVSPQQRECGTFPLLFFLEIIHISLKEGWFICRGRECRCGLFIYLFISSNIFTLGSVSMAFSGTYLKLFS